VLFIGCSQLTWPLKQKWFWMLFFKLLVILIGAFVVAFVIFTLSPTSLFLTVIAVLILWVVVRSYRKWVADRSEEKYGQQEPQRAL
jgi:positive regulator of sigma E activity